MKTCPTCGNEFDSKTRRFCSVKCAAASRPQNQPQPSKRKQCICEWCKSEFETRHDHPGRFCSRKCRSEFAAHQPKGKHGKRVTVCCDICGNEYAVFESYYRARGSRFCSLECKNKGNSLDKMGAGNPNYIGGTRYPDRGRDWSAQRKAAVKRDGYKCCICGRKPKKGEKRVLDVHHITPYKEFGGDWIRANALSNLITLCRNCHIQVEDYGLPCPMPLL